MVELWGLKHYATCMWHVNRIYWLLEFGTCSEKVAIFSQCFYIKILVYYSHCSFFETRPDSSKLLTVPSCKFYTSELNPVNQLFWAHILSLTPITADVFLRQACQLNSSNNSCNLHVHTFGPSFHAFGRKIVYIEISTLASNVFFSVKIRLFCCESYLRK